MQFRDALTLDAPKRTKDGFLAVRAKAARTGVYQYTGREVDPDNAHGLRDKAIVNVLRDDATVFDKAAVQSFIGKPVTDDHPSESVTAANWRDHARGTIMGALKEGEYLAFDLLLTDAATIAKVDAGKRELSNGYGAELEFGSFKAADGTICDARQAKITGGNHVALVDRGRAGSECAIKDGFAVCDAITASELDRLKASITTDERTGSMPHTLMIDGLQVTDVSDGAKAAIEKLQGQLKDADQRVTDAEAKVVEHTATIAARDSRIAELEQSLKDAEITPAKLADAAKEFADVQAKAKALGVTVAADADAAAIKKAVVDAKMGDAAKDYSDDHIAIAFAALTKDAKVDPVRDALREGLPHIANDEQAVSDARAAMIADLKGVKPAAAA